MELLLLISVMLVIMAAWNLNTFLRLRQASTTYSSGDAFENACHVSTTYTNGGVWVAVIMLGISLVLLGIVLIKIKNEKIKLEMQVE